MKRNVGSSGPPLKWNEMKWKVYLFFNSGCEMKINEINSSLMTVKWGTMKFIMKFSKTSHLFRIGNKNTWERPWEPTKRFIEFYEKSVLLNLSVFQTQRSFSSSQRLTHRPHRRQDPRHLHERAHTYQLIWIPIMECRVTRPHVLHELVIHPEHDKHVNLLDFQTHV
jgi:hypothetical protein